MIWGIFLVWKYYAWTDHVFVQLPPENKVNSSESPRNSIWKRKDNNPYMWNSWGTSLTPKGMLTMTSYTFHLWDTCSKSMDVCVALGHMRWCFMKQGNITAHENKFNFIQENCITAAKSHWKEQYFHLVGNTKINPRPSKNISIFFQSHAVLTRNWINERKHSW